MTITPMLEPEGKIISIGTKWHEHDIHWYLQSLSNYKSNVYKAIIDEDNKKVLWPDQWPYNKLVDRKAGMGSASFEMQYQNNVVSSEDSPVKREWVELALEDYKHPQIEIPTYIGVDLASKGEESDYFTITVIGVDQGKVYVLDGIKTKASLFKQFELIKSYDAKWKPMKIGIEQAAQQKIIVDQFTESSLLPIIPIKSSIVNDRMSRVQRLSVLFETGRILINPKLSEWADELISFPRGANDDTIDSLSFAIQSSQLEEEERGIDWSIVPSLIKTKTVDMSKRSSDHYRVTKV
jgi:predicted phage terminase large subunit-like protein